MNWLIHQFETFNVLMIGCMVLFVTILSKANTQKMLKEQSQEFYNDTEEIKQTIRDHSNNKQGEK